MEKPSSRSRWSQYAWICSVLAAVMASGLAPARADVQCGPGEFASHATDVDEVTITNETVLEGDSGTAVAQFTVTVSQVVILGNEVRPSFHGQPLHVGYQTAAGSATSGTDFVAEDSDIVIPTTTHTGSITIDVVGDAEVEQDETFSVQITDIAYCLAVPASIGVAPAAHIVLPTATGTIQNDDFPQITVDDVSVTEGDAGTVDATFTISATAPVFQTVFVDYATSDDTATTADGDYVAQSGQVSIPPGGSLTATVTVPVRGDIRSEGDETFFLGLIIADNGDIADEFGVGTIVDDDTPSAVRLVEAPATAEGAGSATVTVERTGDDITQAVSVQVRASAGTATAGEDFSAVTRTAQWAAGQTGTRTVRIPLLDDNLVERDETVRIDLVNPQGTVLTAPTSLELIIVDDEAPGDIAGIGDPEIFSVVEGETQISVRVATAGGTPLVGATVFWSAESSVEGLATFANGPETVTGGDGVTTQVVLLGNIPGTVTVTASLSPQAARAAGLRGKQQTSVQFEIVARGNLEELFDEARQGELSLAQVLDEACISPQGEFADLCAYVFSLGDADQGTVVQEMTPREVPAQARSMLEMPKEFFREVGRRLAALRGSGSRLATDQLALVIDGREVRIGQIADAMTHRFRSEEGWIEERVNRALALARQGDDIEGGGTGGGQPPAERQDEPIDFEKRWGFFLSGRIATGDRPGTVREEGFDADIQGLVAGVDRRIGQRGVVGVAAGYLDTDLELDRDGGGLDATGTNLTAYATYFRDQFYLQGAASVGRTEFDLTRHVDLPVPFQGQSRFVADGDTEGDELAVSGSAGWNWFWGPAALEGYLRGSYVEVDLDRYVEGGAGPFSLVIEPRSMESLLSEAGLSWTYAVSTSWGVLQPMLRGSYLHEFEDASRLIRGSFVQDVQQLEFVVPTDEQDPDYFNVGAGVTATTAHGRSFYLLYDTDLERDDLEVGTFTFGLRLEF